MPVKNDQKARRALTTGAAKRSHSVLITSTALALFLSAGTAIADAPSVTTSGVKAVKGEDKTFHEETIKRVTSNGRTPLRPLTVGNWSWRAAQSSQLVSVHMAC